MSDTLRVLIVDDEPLARAGMRYRLYRQPNIEVVGECEDGYEAVELIQDLKPDVVLLDIEMPGLDGFGVVSSLKDFTMPAIIFVTAYDEYAIKAFRVHAVDYLVKPVEEDHLAEALTKARKRLVTDNPNGSLADISREHELLQNDKAPERYLARILIKQNHKVFFAKVEDVIRIESADNYLRVVTKKGTHIIRGTMRDIQRHLNPAQFLRIHRQVIVNLDQIREITTDAPGEYIVHLLDGSSQRLGRNYRDALMERGF